MLLKLQMLLNIQTFLKLQTLFNIKMNSKKKAWRKEVGNIIYDEILKMWNVQSSL